MASSRSTIELVDRLDRKAVTAEVTSPGNATPFRKRFYQKIGVASDDLLLEVEEGGGDNGNASPTAPDESTDEYIGLEMNLELERRSRRQKKQLLLFTLVSLFIGGCIYWSRGNDNDNTQQQQSAQNNKGGTTDSSSGVDDSVTTPTTPADDTTEDMEISLWPTRAPLPTFDICPPPLDKLRTYKQVSPIYLISNLLIVPEASTMQENLDDNTEQWEFSFSSMDISDEASIIAVGLSDFSCNTDWSVGMVRVFGWSCKDNDWIQLGQDLLGQHENEEFGHRVSSSRDGKVMAISAPQQDYDGGIGFVEVYYLNDNHWDLLGSRIEELEETSSDYYNMGHAIDLSDKGDTLAVLAITDKNQFVMRVFQYDFNAKKWVRKGHDLDVSVNYADDGDFDPQLSLSEEGDELTMADPQLGAITYKFQFEKDKWVKSITKSASWDQDDYWIESYDLDDSGDLIAFSAWDHGGSSSVKVIDFKDDAANEVYVNTFKDFNVDICVAVSDDGQVAAVVASKDDEDDNEFWTDDDVGAMAIVSKDDTDGQWKVVGKGTHAENMGVSGSFVALSGDGQIAAVGSDTVVQLYGIALNHKNLGNQSSTVNEVEKEMTGNATAIFDICTPFPNGTVQDHVGDLDKFPKQKVEHTLSLAMSADSSIVAVGIDSYDGEDRGMARVFAWDCASQSYKQRGQDLFGSDEFDGFGQSVDLSSDGNTLVVGANQPPPGKSGYVEVYSFVDGEWKIVGHRLDNVKDIVEDIGRQVRISNDGNVLMFSGSVIKESDHGFTGSFIRVMENVDGEWKSKGDDLLFSISYDYSGAEVRISLSGDGQTLGVTGYYSTFAAKIYTFDQTEKNWTETLIPPFQAFGDIEEDGWDYDFQSYFYGNDISLNDNGMSVAIVGVKYEDLESDTDDSTQNYEESGAVVRVLSRTSVSGNWTMSHDPIDYTDDYMATSVAISGDGQKLAVGIDSHGDILDQGALFVTMADDSDLGWNSLGKIDGRHRDDLLGSRVTISSDGNLAAASSRKGYIVFFKLG